MTSLWTLPEETIYQEIAYWEDSLYEHELMHEPNPKWFAHKRGIENMLRVMQAELDRRQEVINKTARLGFLTLESHDPTQLKLKI